MTRLFIEQPLASPGSANNICWDICTTRFYYKTTPGLSGPANTCGIYTMWLFNFFLLERPLHLLLIIIILLLLPLLHEAWNASRPSSSPAGTCRTGTVMSAYRPGLLLQKNDRFEIIHKLQNCDMYYMTLIFKCL